jgi:hypothetical protein
VKWTEVEEVGDFEFGVVLNSEEVLELCKASEASVVVCVYR